ncbi:zf-HC2 domain-containing protein [Streptomyces sp. NPDC059785]|uniref:zf-HC2 domain-containing protein n=1 Tax=Streptomyces sp. NPDC059785 TaxID=3346945 RepID=UPI0036672FBC
MTRWHAPDDLIARYTDGSLPEPDAWSLEKHLEHCTPCATRTSRAAAGGAAGTVLAEVREAVLRAAAGPAPAPHAATAPTASAPAAPATAAPAASMPAAPVPATAAHPATPPAASAPATAASASAPVASAGAAPAPAASFRAVGGRFGRVLWAAGPALRGAWTGAVLLVALGALALAYGGGLTGARPLLLAVAPVVPVAGVALSYGRHADPLHEIVAASPAGGLRLVLIRTAAVLAVSVPLLTAAGLLLPAADPRLPRPPAAAAWLLPGLALTLATLALAGFVGCRTAAAVTGGGWLAALAAPVLVDTGTGPAAGLTEQLSRCLTGVQAQGCWAVAAVLCALLLAARRTAYDRLETM